MEMQSDAIVPRMLQMTVYHYSSVKMSKYVPKMSKYVPNITANFITNSNS